MVSLGPPFSGPGFLVLHFPPLTSGPVFSVVHFPFFDLFLVLHFLILHFQSPHVEIDAAGSRPCFRPKKSKAGRKRVAIPHELVENLVENRVFD